MRGDAPSPWRLGGLGVRELARRVWAQISNDEVVDRGAALAYYLLFALFPALLFLTALLGFLPLPGLMDRLMAYLDQVLPGDSGAVIKRTLGEVLNPPRGGLLSIGALTALWAASSGMVSMMTALNVAYDVEDARPWWKRRLIAAALTLGFSLMILAGLVFLVFGRQIGALAASRLGLGDVVRAAWNTASISLAVLLVLVGITLVYYLAPAVRQRWRWVTPGSVVALVLWLGMSFGLRAYVTYFGNYNATYGSIGGVILLMLWLYLTGVVMLVGAEINAEIERAAAARGNATAKAPGERAAPADRGHVGAGAPARDAGGSEAIIPPVASRHAELVHRDGWLTVAAVAAGALLGWAVSRFPVRDVVGAGAKAVETGRTVAAALAAAERLQQALHHTPSTPSSTDQSGVVGRAA